nr:uncharacterized protein LOC129272618 [Lytechinus pictus]
MESSNFHWKQSVYRKIQALGLAPMYTRDEEKRLLLQQLMALPFLPVGEVVPEFRRLRLQKSTWITNPTWPVRVWSTYGKAIRTNNDAEGYNHRLNRRAGGKSMGVYQLSSLLFKESQLVDLTVRMVDRRLITRHQRRQTRTMQARVFRAWPDNDTEGYNHRLNRRAGGKSMGVQSFFLSFQLFDYLESTWITNPTWPARVWSMYGKAIRTNNDAEGYNHRLNRRAGGKSMGVYQLSSLLFKESQLVDPTVRMVDRRLLTRHQRRQTRTMQARVFRAWEEHRDGERTRQDLLTVCAHSYGHAPA